MRISVNYQVFNHPSMIFMVSNHQLFYVGIQLLLSWSCSTWLIHQSGISINCTTIFVKYRCLQCRQDISLVSNAPIYPSFGLQNIPLPLQVKNPTTGMLFLIGFTETHFPNALETAT